MSLRYFQFKNPKKREKNVKKSENFEISKIEFLLFFFVFSFLNSQQSYILSFKNIVRPNLAKKTHKIKNPQKTPNSRENREYRENLP